MPDRQDGLPARQVLPNYLAPGATTVGQNGADVRNDFCKGIKITLNVTAASGTGGLSARIQAKDPLSGNYVGMFTPAAVIATGTFVYTVYPAASTTGGETNTAQQQLPRTFRVRVNAGDASSYTYTVTLELIP